MSDLIRLEDVLAIIDRRTVKGKLQVAREVLKLPTIEPERKKGMWIEHNPHKWGLGIVFECSECGEKIDCEPSNFCPNCGAEMEGQDEKISD